MIIQGNRTGLAKLSELHDGKYEAPKIITPESYASA